ncbi:hypothetical protein SLA2020_182910 [Shorea laevis]
MGAGVEAERPCRTEIAAVLAVPHVRIGDENVGVGVTNAENCESAGGCPELETVLIGAYQYVSVVRTTAAIIYSEGAVNGRVCLRFGANEDQKNEN